jgi:hypothetical protein
MKEGIIDIKLMQMPTFERRNSQEQSDCSKFGNRGKCVKEIKSLYLATNLALYLSTLPSDLYLTL